jgi:UDPglucose 6-dehydrogenase
VTKRFAHERIVAIFYTVYASFGDCKMKVSMIGTGYVGLVSGVCFAEIGHDITCIDVDIKKIDMLNRGESPIFEPGLTELIKRNSEAKRIKFSTDYSSVKEADITFIGVGTPSSDSGEADLTYLKAAAVDVAKNISDGAVVVIKSTVPVGTCDMIRKLIRENSRNNFYLVNNPEFLKEGSAIDDFMKPDRVIIGYKEPLAAEMMEKLYAPLMLQGNPIYTMSNRSAEMSKYAANCLLATKISFINEIANLCDETGADINEVRQGITSDRRIGPHFLYPGPGYGGSCFPKDVKALIHLGKQYSCELEIIKSVEDVNEKQKLRMFNKVKSYFKGDLSGKKIAFWGIAFKPNTDDIREAPAIKMAKEFIANGAEVNYFDPVASDNFEALMNSNPKTEGKTHRFENKYDCLKECDGLILMTEWREFRAPDFEEIKSRLKTPVLFDARNLYPTKTVHEASLDYIALGKNVSRD